MKFIFFLALLATFWLLAGKLTDRICDKPYSPEYKQTAQYKSMQCPK